MTKILVAAGLGGMLPTLCRLGASFAVSPNQPAPAVGVYLALGIFSAIGMMVAYGFEESVVKKAFVLGIAAPGIVTSIFSGAIPPNSHVQQTRMGTSRTSGKSTPSGSTMTFFGVDQADAQNNEFSGVNRAQLGPAMDAGPERKLIVKPRVSSGAWATPTSVELRFLTKSGAALNQLAVSSGLTSTVIVPPGATAVQARSAGSTTVAPLPPTEFQSAVLHLQVKTKPRNDFLWALGAPRSATVSGISSRISNIESAAPLRAPAPRAGNPSVSTEQPQAHGSERGAVSKCGKVAAEHATRSGCAPTRPDRP